MDLTLEEMNRRAFANIKPEELFIRRIPVAPKNTKRTKPIIIIVPNDSTPKTSKANGVRGRQSGSAKRKVSVDHDYSIGNENKRFVGENQSSPVTKGRGRPKGSVKRKFSEVANSSGEIGRQVLTTASTPSTSFSMLASLMANSFAAPSSSVTSISSSGLKIPEVLMQNNFTQLYKATTGMPMPEDLMAKHILGFIQYYEQVKARENAAVNQETPEKQQSNLPEVFSSEKVVQEPVVRVPEVIKRSPVTCKLSVTKTSTPKTFSPVASVSGSKKTPVTRKYLSSPTSTENAKELEKFEEKPIVQMTRYEVFKQNVDQAVVEDPSIRRSSRIKFKKIVEKEKVVSIEIVDTDFNQMDQMEFLHYFGLCAI